MYAIKKDGKYMGAGSNDLESNGNAMVASGEGIAWYDEPCKDVVSHSEDMMQVQLKHLSSRIDLEGAEVVPL